MDKNQPYFDPYNFNNIQPQMPPQMGPNQMPPDVDIMQSTANPAMFYEQQYMYYRYLTQMLEYKTKLKEFERLSKDSNAK
jgi:hypothetical protein